MAVTNLKDAIRLWEKENKGPLGSATEIILSFRNPPIQKLDNSLSLLTSCEFLSLSSNVIEKIAGFNLTNLRVLSLARNNIKDLSGLESLSESLEQLWISYNFIEKLKVLPSLKKLRVLYIAHNLVREPAELQRLADLPLLEDLLFLGNPLAESMDPEKYQTNLAKWLPQLKKLDGESIMRNIIE